MDFTQLRVHNLSSLTMVIFGMLALLLGLIGLIQPQFLLTTLGLNVLDERVAGDYTLAFITASAMASFNMGVYYVLAALNNMKRFYGWTVPFRIVTFTVFTLAALSGTAPAAFIGVGLWELAGALATGVALRYERRHNIV